MQWASKRARGRVGDDEFDGDGGRSPKRGTATCRRCRASGDSWSGGEEEGVEEELLSYSGERGVAGVDGGELGCGRRGSVVHGNGAGARSRAKRGARNALRGLANSLGSPG